MIKDNIYCFQYEITNNAHAPPINSPKLFMHAKLCNCYSLNLILFLNRIKSNKNEKNSVPIFVNTELLN